MTSPKINKTCKDCKSPMDRFGSYCHDCKAVRVATRKSNASKWVSNSKAKNKRKAVAYKGGKCVVCGYCRSDKALVFHHIDPSEKDFGISNVTKSFDNMKSELDKCVLLCNRCHTEVHEGIVDLPPTAG